MDAFLENVRMERLVLLLQQGMQAEKAAASSRDAAGRIV
jgi:hypothetical protein